MEIIACDKRDSDLLAKIVSKSNKDVAELFGLNSSNAPKHPSFCTSEWILSDLERGQEYFISIDDGKASGCVAIEQPDENTVYLNRLSVLPECRCRGIGSKLVTYVLEHSTVNKASVVSIGIIAEHTQLKKWYQKLGFTVGTTKKFDHLPFNVLYMQYGLLSKY